MQTELYNPVLKSLSSGWRQNASLVIVKGLQELLLLYSKSETWETIIKFEIKLFTSLNYEILGQLSEISVSQVLPSLMTGCLWPNFMLLCFCLAGGCSRSAALQTCPQEAPDRGTGAGDPWAFSHYKHDFFLASSQASPSSPKVKTCAKHAKLCTMRSDVAGFALCIILCLRVLVLRMLHKM